MTASVQNFLRAGLQIHAHRVRHERVARLLMVDIVDGGGVDIAVADLKGTGEVADAAAILRDAAVEIVRITDTRPGLAAVIGNGQVVLRGREL